MLVRVLLNAGPVDPCVAMPTRAMFGLSRSVGCALHEGALEPCAVRDYPWRTGGVVDAGTQVPAVLCAAQLRPRRRSPPGDCRRYPSERRRH